MPAEPSPPSADRRRGRRPPPEELIERRRSEIVRAAFQVFASRGYQDAGIADIAERLGIGHGTFYRYFRSKRDILDHVVDYGVERIIGELGVDSLAPATTIEALAGQLREIGGRLFALLDAEPGVGRIVLLEATAIDDEMTARVLGLLDAFAGLAGALVRDGVRAGFLRADLDPEMLGRALVGLVLPGLFLAVRGEAGPEARHAYIETVVALVCDGTAATGGGPRRLA